MIENAFDPLPLSSGVPVPMCWCGDPCKVAKSNEEDTIDRGTGCVPILCLSLHFVTLQEILGSMTTCYHHKF